MDLPEKNYSLMSLKEPLSNCGIILLTGEACKYSMRMLCDLTQEGIENLKAYFSVQNLTLNDNYNSKGIASIMLSRVMLTDIIVFCLLKQGYDVIQTNHHITAFKDRDYKEYLEGLRKMGENLRFYKGNSYDRNVHQFTGRIY